MRKITLEREWNQGLFKTHGLFLQWQIGAFWRIFEETDEFLHEKLARKADFFEFDDRNTY